MPKMSEAKPNEPSHKTKLVMPFHLNERNCLSPNDSIYFNPAYMMKMATLNNPPIRTLMPNAVPNTNPMTLFQAKFLPPLNNFKA